MKTCSNGWKMVKMNEILAIRKWDFGPNLALLGKKYHLAIFCH